MASSSPCGYPRFCAGTWFCSRPLLENHAHARAPVTIFCGFNMCDLRCCVLFYGSDIAAALPRLSTSSRSPPFKSSSSRRYHPAKSTAFLLQTVLESRGIVFYLTVQHRPLLTVRP
eukprot:10968-Rhodomonas_salina.3